MIDASTLAPVLAPTLAPALAPITESFIARGDLAHLALLMWAVGASALLVLTLRELASANRRFDAFVRELARFNSRHSVNTE